MSKPLTIKHIKCSGNRYVFFTQSAKQVFVQLFSHEINKANHKYVHRYILNLPNLDIEVNAIELDDIADHCSRGFYDKICNDIDEAVARHENKITAQA